MEQPGLFLYDDSADPESSCTSPAFYKAMIRWAQNLHRAGIENLVTQQPVPHLYDDGLGTLLISGQCFRSPMTTLSLFSRGG